MNTSVCTTAEELYAFLMEAELRLGDPSQAVCLLVVPWRDAPLTFADECGLAVRFSNAKMEIVFEMVDEDGVRELPLAVDVNDPVIDERGVLKAFHVRPLARGVWALAPSLHVPGALHAFVVLTGVPDPAPWQRLILMPSEVEIKWR